MRPYDPVGALRGTYEEERPLQGEGEEAEDDGEDLDEGEGDDDGDEGRRARVGAVRTKQSNVDDGDERMKEGRAISSRVDSTA